MSRSIFSQQQQELQRLLRELRRKAGMTQIDLAKRLNQPQSFVSKYESGERLLDIIELRQICGAVGITLAEFARLWEDTLE